jgi:GMP synthase (glutamine-hydrolysing)
MPLRQSCSRRMRGLDCIALTGYEGEALRILCIQHADFETPGTIEQWASENEHSFKIEKPYRGEQLSDVGDFDILIPMGGPQSALQAAEFPYLHPEIALIRTAFSKNKKILGFCLGAQLIGQALGANTERSPEKEIGVYPIRLTTEGTNDPLFKGLPHTFPVIHWHSDMPGLTDSAAVLASSPGCPRQIVRYGNNAYGFQCHMEITVDGIKTMIEAVPEDLRPSRFTQSRAALLANDYSSINSSLVTILDRLVESGV